MNLRRFRIAWIPLLFVLILPPFIALILGWQFQDQVMKHIPVAIADYDHTSTSRSLIKMIEDNDTFHVALYAETDAEVEAAIQKGSVAAAIIIPPQFEHQMATGDNEPIVVLCDNAQMILAGTAKGKLSEILSTLNMGSLSGAMARALQLQPEQAAAMAQPMGLTVEMLNPGKSNNAVSSQGSILNILQVAVCILAVEITRKNDAGKPKLLLKNALLCGVFGTLSASLVLLIEVKLFDFPSYGNLLWAFLIIFLYCISMASMGMMVRLSNKGRDDAVQKVSSLSITFLLSGYAVAATPEIVQRISYFIPYAHFGNPVRDVMLMGYGFSDVLPDIVWILVFILLLWAGRAAKMKLNQRRREHVQAVA